MNKLVFVVALTLVSQLFGAPNKKQPRQITPEERAENQRRLMVFAGGIVEKPGEGKIAVVNCQSKFTGDEIRQRIAVANRQFRVRFDLVEGKFEMYKLPEGYNAAFYIVDDPSLPMSLYAIEAGWGMMNVSQIGDSKRRFARQFNRAAVLTFGGATSQLRTSPLQSVRNAEQLDKVLIEDITFDCLQSVMLNLQNFGVTQARKSTYRKACMDGWAPAPTNEYQKAIYEEVKSKPTKPMKIEFDPKKGE